MTAPERIYLTDGDAEGERQWCVDQVTDEDVEYVRRDRGMVAGLPDDAWPWTYYKHPAQKEIGRLKALLREVADEFGGDHYDAAKCLDLVRRIKTVLEEG